MRETDETRAKRDEAASRNQARQVVRVDDKKRSTIITPTLSRVKDASNQVWVSCCCLVLHVYVRFAVGRWSLVSVIANL